MPGRGKARAMVSVVYICSIADRTAGVFHEVMPFFISHDSDAGQARGHEILNQRHPPDVIVVVVPLAAGGPFTDEQALLLVVAQ